MEDYNLNRMIIIGGGVVISLLFALVLWFFQRLIKTLDRIDARVYSIDTTLASSENRLKTVETDLLAITDKFTDVEGRFIVLETEHRVCPKCTHR